MATKAKSKNKKAAVKKAAPKKAPKKIAAAKPAPKMKEASSSKTSKLVFTPLEDRVIIEVAAAEEKTSGGLYIPESAADRPNRGRILAAGPGRRSKKGRLRPLDVKVGDEVLFAQYSGTKIQVGTHDFLILREEDLLGIVT